MSPGVIPPPVWISIVMALIGTPNHELGICRPQTFPVPLKKDWLVEEHQQPVASSLGAVNDARGHEFICAERVD